MSKFAPADRLPPQSSITFVPPPEPDLLTVKEAATLLRCSKSYLDKLRCAGGGPEFIRLGLRKILYRRLDLLTWAKSRRFDNTSQYLK